MKQGQGRQDRCESKQEPVRAGEPKDRLGPGHKGQNTGYSQGKGVASQQTSWSQSKRHKTQKAPTLKKPKAKKQVSKNLPNHNSQKMPPLKKQDLKRPKPKRPQNKKHNLHSSCLVMQLLFMLLAPAKACLLAGDYWLSPMSHCSLLVVIFYHLIGECL